LQWHWQLQLQEIENKRSEFSPQRTCQLQLQDIENKRNEFSPQRICENQGNLGEKKGSKRVFATMEGHLGSH